MTSSIPSADVAVRIATTPDVDPIVSAITTAFFDDPLWGPAFPDTSARTRQAGALWRFYVTSALRYPWLLVTEQVEAVAVWTPPGGSEITEDEETRLEGFLVDIAGADEAGGITAIAERFDAHHPTEPHFYLGFLATHDDHRGRGLGMSLLRESLRRIDEIGAPAYLESSNPANNARYESVGFRERDRFTVPSGHVVSTMWRPGSS